MGAARLLFEASHELETNEMSFLFLLIYLALRLLFFLMFSCIIEDVGGEKFDCYDAIFFSSFCRR